MQDIENIYKEYSKLIFKYLFCLSHNAEIAEDLMQETFLCAVNNINKFKGNCKISSWLCQIAKHLWYKELKKIKKYNLVQIDDIMENLKDTDNLDETIENNERKQELYNKIQMLKGNVRQVMELRIIGEFSFKQIGDILGKNENWARVTYYRGKEQIRGGKDYEKSKL